MKLPSCEVFAAHVETRSQFKTCDLAAMYGVTPPGLVKKGLTLKQARSTLKYHHEVYTVFWEWILDQIEAADIEGRAETVFGWQIKVDAEAERFNARSVGNFFVQGNSAEIMHLSAILATERNLGVCGIVHDAFLLEAPVEDAERQVRELKACMDEASAVVLDGFVMGVDGHQRDKWVVYPDRYMDERGEVFWNEVQGSLELIREREKLSLEINCKRERLEKND
jgi:DNA polymerase I